MSNRVRGRPRAESTNEQRLTKAEKRALAKAARAKAAAAKRRRQVLTGTLAGLAVVGVVIAAFVYFGGSDGGGAGSAGSTTSTTTTTDPRLASKPTVTKGTGELTKLTVTPLIEGNGTAAQAGKQITVHYVGVSYATGAEFDSSWNRSEPFSFQLGAGKVIPGWDQGLVGVKVGSRVQLDIPSDLAYGDNPDGGRPAGPLRFVVDVLAVE